MKGVLLINLGTPDNLELISVKKYLKEFLSDGYVVDIPTIIRKILVNLIIVPFRSRKTQEAYKSIWTKKGSPLIINTNLIKEKLDQKIESDEKISQRRARLKLKLLNPKLTRYQKTRLEQKLYFLDRASVKSYDYKNGYLILSLKRQDKNIKLFFRKEI